MTSRAALTVISHGASLTNGLMRSVNSIKKKKKKTKGRGQGYWQKCGLVMQQTELKKDAK